MPNIAFNDGTRQMLLPTTLYVMRNGALGKMSSLSAKIWLLNDASGTGKVKAILKARIEINGSCPVLG